MKNIALAAAAALMLAACAGTSTTVTDNSTLSDPSGATAGSNLPVVNYVGQYEGSLACADCEGQYTILSLNSDNTYTLRTKYMGRSDTFFTRSGTYTWDAATSQVSLGGEGGRYRVSEGQVLMLDKNGQEINSANPAAYRLTKGNGSLEERYWKLIELNGSPVVMTAEMKREPHLIFRMKDSRVAGFSGCNNVTATFKTNVPNRINFSQLVSTRMACPGAKAVEPAMLEALKTTNTYSLQNDTLSLQSSNEGKVNARFVAVYMQ